MMKVSENFSQIRLQFSCNPTDKQMDK